MRHWLETFEKHAHDTIAWRYRQPKFELNFSDVTSQEAAEFLAPETRIMSCKQEKEDRLVMQHCAVHESDEEALARFVAENPHLAQAEYEFFASRDTQGKKAIKEDEAGPSRVIKEDGAYPLVTKFESGDKEEELDCEIESVHGVLEPCGWRG